ncbi:oxidoreductase FAD/NAD(P)-binding [Verticillium alfalfae VaMs.102]|uniref:Oxidoreductase FAD/NAD(P)-binding n=1 Tax=Verticillium alfalfae (strain VaMs.102 / ATCC MYA-4576 / FGSC 10136) TaxID=526221 RepID=C9SSZ1_VERA1|nr:oxidoreductase FAD/NAD(P)-binding [Verticillium alfalfae VaMs.102]EEY21906.1 oxidoreductase FAD/NAD(P)-binding [Verticillium alfalfae VaMs.102]
MSAATAAPVWHPGELAVHRLLSVPTPHANPTSAGLPRPYAARIAAAPLLALGTLDAEGRPWTTLWGGAAGVAGAMGPGLLGVRARVDAAHDPVLRALWGGPVVDEQVVRSGDKVVSGLGIDLQTRDRVKLMGRLVAGAVAQGEVQMAVRVEGSLGNCPKYLNGRALVARTPEVEGVEDGFPLSARARRVVDQADLFFLSSGHGTGMDTNHRGGSKGFVRIGRNDEGAVELIYPEYSGNRLYQTLGNLQANPLVGITIPDFDTSDVLYVRLRILLGNLELGTNKSSGHRNGNDSHRRRCRRPAAAHPPRHQNHPHLSPPRQGRAPHARHVPAGRLLPLQPARPPPRRRGRRRSALDPARDRHPPAPPAPDPEHHALHVRPRRPARDPVPGEYVTLDFAAELDHGWSHMRDDDPRSLNEDWVRSFTISGYPSARAFEITARVKRGGATELLAKHLLRGGPLEVAAPGLLTGGKAFEVIWGVRGDDVGVVRDAVERIPGLAARLSVHVTGKIGEADEEALAKVEALGVRIERRRMEKHDLERVFEGEKRKFYLCAAPALLTVMKGWLENEEVVWEDFGY